MLKKLLSCFAVLSLFVMCASTTSVYASSNNVNTNNDILIQPRWWPGNPNPQPGTEDWFFQNPTYGTNSPDPIAKECGKKAIYDALMPSLAIDAFVTWYAKRKFDLYTFGLTFVAEVTYKYATCLWEAGVR